MNDTLTWEQAVQWLKLQPDSQELVKACYYDEPLLIAAIRFASSEEWSDVKHYLKDWLPGNVLDLGAGNGISSYAFAQAGCKVISLEPDPSTIVGAGAIRILAEQAKLAIQVDQAFGEKLPYPDASFDIVYGRQVLHHALDLQQLCRESARVLRSGGVFMGTREHVISHRKDLEIFLQRHPLHKLYGGENALLLREYCTAIENAGLLLRKVIAPKESPINYFPLTQQQVKVSISLKLQHYLGISEQIASKLASHPKFRSLLCQLYTWWDQEPGRLYSFIAIKP